MRRELSPQMNSNERGQVRSREVSAFLPWLVASFMTSLIAGCASTPPKAPNSDAFHVISSNSPRASIAAAQVVDLSAGETRFSVIDEDSESPDKAIIIRRESTNEYGSDFAIHEGDRRSEFLKRNSDGSVAMTAVIDREENALTLFEPPLIVAPALLKANQPFTSEAAMRVVALGNPAKHRERGTARRSITYVDDVLLRIGSREIPVARIEIRFDADLRFADADELTTLYVARGIDGGVILQLSREKIVILGTFPRTTERTLLRVE